MAEVDFSADVTAIYGRNGIGKTALFDATEFALFGSVSRLEAFGDTVDYITRVGADTEPLVQLALRDDSNTIDIATTWNRETRSIGAIRGSRPWQHHRDMLYGVLVDRDSLGSRREVAAVRELFRATLMLSQESIRDFVESSAEDRSRVLASLAGLAHIQRSKDKAESVASLAHRQASVLSTQLDSATAAEREAVTRLNESEARAAARRQQLTANRVSAGDLREAAAAAGIDPSGDPSAPRQVIAFRTLAEATLRDLEVQLARLASLEAGQMTHRERMARLQSIEGEPEALRSRGRALRDRLDEAARQKEAAEVRLDALRREAAEVNRSVQQLHGARSEAEKIVRLRAELEQLDPRHCENELKIAESQVAAAVRQRTDALAAKNAAARRVTELRDRGKLLASLSEQAAKYARVGEDLARERSRLGSIDDRLRSLEATAATEEDALRSARTTLAAALEASNRLTRISEERATLLSRVRAFATGAECPLCGVRHQSAEALTRAIDRTLQEVPDAVRDAAEAEQAARNALAQQEVRVSALAGDLRSSRVEREQIRLGIEELSQRIRDVEDQAQRLSVAISIAEVQAHLDVVNAEVRSQEDIVRQHDTAATMASNMLSAAEQAIAAAKRKIADQTSRRHVVERESAEAERALAELGFVPPNVPNDAEFADQLRSMGQDLSRIGLERSTLDTRLASATADHRAMVGERARIDATLAQMDAETGELRGQAEVFRRRWQEAGGEGEPSDQGISEVRLAVNEKVGKVVRLREMAEQVQLADEVDALEAAAEAARTEYQASARSMQELRNRLTIIRRAQATAQSWIGPLAENLRSAVARTVEAHQREIERHFRAMIPSPHLFDGIGMHHHGERLDIGIRYRGQSAESGEPRVFLSNAQLNVLALAMFMSMGAKQRWSRLAVLLLDDPIQHLDDLDAVAFLDTLRAVALGRFGAKRQIVLSTCDKTMYRLMIQKFRLIEASGARFTAISLLDGGIAGPMIHYDFGGPAARESRIA